jgi:DNA-binding NarL/FixJ family response regulator
MQALLTTVKEFRMFSYTYSLKNLRGITLSSVRNKETMMKLRILIVDDMAAMRILIKQYLRNNDAIVVVGEASNGEEALRKTQEFQPDVVILDMSMPGASGVEVSRKIKSLLPNISVYLCSAYELNEFKELNIGMPADGFIQKSSMKPELQAMIRKELELKKIMNL